MAPNIGYEIKATATPAGLKITQTKRTINSQPKRTRSHLRFAPQCLSPTWGELETMPNGNSVAPARPNSHSQSPSFPLHCDQINNKPPQNKAAKGAGIPLKSNVSWSPSGFFEVASTENRASRQAAAITTVNGNNVAQAHPGGRTATRLPFHHQRHSHKSRSQAGRHQVCHGVQHRPLLILSAHPSRHSAIEQVTQLTEHPHQKHPLQSRHAPFIGARNAHPRL